MHVQIRSDEGKLLADLHISRELQNAQILMSEEEMLEQLVQIARSHGVPEVTIMVPDTEEGVGQMESLGWKISNDLIVMSRER